MGRGCACRRGPVCDTQTESPQHRTFVVNKLACLGSLYFTSLAPVHRLASQACTTSRQLDDTRASPRFYPSVLRRPPQSVMIANRSGVNKGSTYIEWKENRLNTRRLPFVLMIQPCVVRNWGYYFTFAHTSLHLTSSIILNLPHHLFYHTIMPPVN